MMKGGIMSKPRKYPEGTGALTMRETARFLGISEYNVGALIKNGSIPSFKVGRSRRISKKALDELMRGENS